MQCTQHFLTSTLECACLGLQGALVSEQLAPLLASPLGLCARSLAVAVVLAPAGPLTRDADGGRADLVLKQQQPSTWLSDPWMSLSKPSL